MNFTLGPVSAPKKVTKIIEYLHFVGTTVLETLLSAPSHCIKQGQLWSPAPFRQWAFSRPETRLEAGRLVVSRHCLGAAFDQEQRAREVLFPICLLKC